MQTRSLFTDNMIISVGNSKDQTNTLGTINTKCLQQSCRLRVKTQKSNTSLIPAMNELKTQHHFHLPLPKIKYFCVNEKKKHTRKTKMLMRNSKNK